MEGIKVWLTCDSCDEYDDFTVESLGLYCSMDSAILHIIDTKAKEEGWRKVDGWTYCPCCAKEQGCESSDESSDSTPKGVE